MINWQQQCVAPCIAVFGQPVQIVIGGVAYSINGVFDEAYLPVDAADGMPVTTVKPCLGINTADINLGGAPVSSLQGSRVTIYASTAGGSPAVDTDYIVQEARTDSHGSAQLILNLAPTPADDAVADGGQDA